MSLLAAQSQWRQRGWLDTILRMVWAVGLVLVIGAIAYRLSVKPSGALMAYAIAVLLAALLNGTPSAIAAIVTAAIMGVFVLPPAGSLYIHPPFRIGYVLFLFLCILISFYRPPRSAMPLKRYNEIEKRSAEPYTEANLPTVANSEEESAIKQRRVIEDMDIYQWERSCAHISDLIWDAQVKLQENDSKQAYILLQHAYEVAAQTRKQIHEVDLLPYEVISSASTALQEEPDQNRELTRGEYRS